MHELNETFALFRLLTGIGKQETDYNSKRPVLAKEARERQSRRLEQVPTGSPRGLQSNTAAWPAAAEREAN